MRIIIEPDHGLINKILTSFSPIRKCTAYFETMELPPFIDIKELKDSSLRKARREFEIHMPQHDISAEILKDLGAEDGREYGAYDEVFKAYHASIKKYVAAIIKNFEDAQEITQDIFARLWERRKEVDPDKNIRGFLFTSAKFLILDYLRRKKVLEKYEQYAGNNYDFATSTDDLVIEKELRILAELTIESMAPQRRKVFKMRYEECKSVEEIAEALNITVATARTHIKLGRKEIQNIFVAYFLMFFMVN